MTTLYTSELTDLQRLLDEQITANRKLQQEIEDHRRTELNLQQLNYRLSRHVQQSLLGVIEWTPELRVSAWNPAAEVIFGYSCSEAIGRTAAELIIPEDIVADIDVLWNRLFRQTGGDYIIQENRTGDGRRIICEWFNTTLSESDGAVTAVMSFVVDRTERIREEEALLVQRYLLEAEVAKRKDAQEKLALEQLKVGELNRSLEERFDAAITDMRRKDQIFIQQSRMAAIGEMIRNISHQWRQPLNNIGLIVQNLRISLKEEQTNFEEIDRNVATVMEIVSHMSATIDDLRNFFRQDTQKTCFIVNMAVKRVRDFVAADLESSNIRVDVTAEENVTVFGYRNEYCQVLFNILTNAREVLAERMIADPRVSIGIVCERDRSVVTIRDNGGGIAEEILPRIFDPYFTTKESGKGTGIGLYMAKVIIEQNMGGSLSVANREGGAEFRIEV